jgi:hypothetical protein
MTKNSASPERCLPIDAVVVDAANPCAGAVRPFKASDDLTSDMWAFAQEFVSDDVRGEAAGVPYGPAVVVGAGASDAERLIAHSGRNPIGQATSEAASAEPRHRLWTIRIANSSR